MENDYSYAASVAYLKSVLGVDSFLRPAGFVEVESESASARLETVSTRGPADSRFAVVVDSSYLDGETRALLVRMITAMKQDTADTLILEILGDASVDEAMSLLTRSPRKAVLVFGQRTAEMLSGGKRLPLAQWLAPLPELPVLITHGLEEIQKDPTLKKVVWQHLQMVMQSLGQE